jgi:alkylated DNA repair dioxygenase AlkB
MTAALQGSLLDLVDSPELGTLPDHLQRTQLTGGAELSGSAWIELRPNWLTGGDEVFRTLLADVPWHAERRQMYDRVVDVPRLTKFYGEGEPLPHPILARARAALSEHYRAELGEDFATAGMCLYRDGRDSVAWHADDRGHGRYRDTMVAILSLGSPRQFLLRPRGGGASLRRTLAHGDLLVMGGSCQRTWEHAVPKTGKPVGPRMSIQFRPRGVT